MGRKIPAQIDMMWPTLLALKDLGGSGHIHEIFQFISQHLKFTEAELNTFSGKTDILFLPWSAAWSRTRLKNINLLEKRNKGVWVLTKLGEDLVSQGYDAYQQYAKDNKFGSSQTRLKTLENNTSHSIDLETSIDDMEEEDWQASLLDILYQISPYDFEKLCQRLLRESGFKEVRVTSKSGDGGMDGYGTLQLNLVSFKVAFQAKRYKGSVGSPEVAKVRGALNSRKERAEKGLIITTGTFTQDAREEAAELPTIDLIDGEALCYLCKQYGLGVETKMVEQVAVHKSFFDNLS